VLSAAGFEIVGIDSTASNRDRKVNGVGSFQGDGPEFHLSAVIIVKETAMKILIKLSSVIISEAIKSLLCENGMDAEDGADNNDFIPDIILLDVNTVCDDLLSCFPDSKVLLLDTGIKKEKLAEALLSFDISGIISADTGFSLFRKALTVIGEGRVWIDKSTIKSFLTESELVAKKETVRRRKVAAGDQR
jgi:hypothetical protein